MSECMYECMCVYVWKHLCFQDIKSVHVQVCVCMYVCMYIYEVCVCVCKYVSVTLHHAGTLRHRRSTLSHRQLQRAEMDSMDSFTGRRRRYSSLEPLDPIAASRRRLACELQDVVSSSCQLLAHDRMVHRQRQERCRKTRLTHCSIGERIS